VRYLLVVVLLMGCEPPPTWDGPVTTQRGLPKKYNRRKAPPFKSGPPPPPPRQINRIICTDVNGHVIVDEDALIGPVIGPLSWEWKDQEGLAQVISVPPALCRTESRWVTEQVTEPTEAFSPVGPS